MKAMRFSSYGGSDVLTYDEVDQPAAGPGQVVVKVAGVAVNPVDAAIRAGYLRQMLPLTLPHTPGIDVSGVVTALGDGVTGWSVGDEVIAFLPLNAPGASAEYAVVAAELLATAPRTVELADAAALPSSGLTAWQALFERADLRTGQTILINGAGGAVGGYAVQLAKQAGATVTATASPRSESRLRALGADHIIDYTATPVTEVASRFDVVLNLVTTGPDETAALVGLVADGGVYVSTTVAAADPGRGVRTIRDDTRSDAAQLAGLVSRLDAGTLRLGEVTRRPLTDLPAVQDKPGPGKTVLIP